MENVKNDSATFLGRLPEEIATRGREVWLAGLGAIATAKDEGAKFLDDLLERGQSMETRATEKVSGVMSDLSETKAETEEKFSKFTSRFEERAEDLVGSALKRFDVPSREEVKDLTDKVDTLTKKVDKLISKMKK